MDEAYEALIQMENDMKEVIKIANRLKRGLLYKNISDAELMKMCGKIIEVIER